MTICTWCGKKEVACRWADDPLVCMKKQLDEFRGGVDEIVETYCEERGLVLVPGVVFAAMEKA